ncbi:MAG: hypothetical protein ACKODK_19595 [Opitutaceae bacterium]
MIVRSHEAQQRIVKPGFLQIQEHRVGAIQRAETALGEPAGGSPWSLECVRVTDFDLTFSAALEDPEQV